MSTLQNVDFLVGALVAIVLLMIMLLVLQWRSSRAINQLTFPAYEYVIKQAEHKASEIIATAQAEARKVAAEAEQAGQRTLGHYTTVGEAMQAQYEQQFATLQNELTKEITGLAEAHKAQLHTFITEGLQTLQSNQTELSTEYETLLGHFKEMTATLQRKTETAVTDLQVQLTQVKMAMAEKLTQESELLQSEVTEHLSAMLSKAEDEISAYRRARLALLDTHIERLVEDVVKQILHRRLSIDEHAELARQALEEAKVNNVL